MEVPMSRRGTVHAERVTVDGVSLSVSRAGDKAAPALLLMHGVPNSSRMFRAVIPELSEYCRIIAPDLPGFGASDVIENASFERFADLVEALLDRLGVEKAFFYLHDFGAPVGLHIATRRPDRVLGLIIQNANAHQTGLGPQWAKTRAFWSEPDAENTEAAFAHLTLEGTRAQYIGGVPDDIAALMKPEDWKEDWRVMSQPGRIDLQRNLIRDYKRHVDRFDDIAAYLKAHQPPALLLWGRHDPFFDLDETRSWLEDLPRLEAHILDGPHLLLETHSDQCAELIKRFVLRCGRRSG
jgi:pimeloyl-ACP methyl ester carboxylesterase